MSAKVPKAKGKGIGAQFEGCTVEYIGSGRQHLGKIPVADREPVKGIAGRPGVAAGRLPKGKQRAVSPMIAAAAAGHPDKFVVRDKSGRVINQD